MYKRINLVQLHVYCVFNVCVCVMNLCHYGYSHTYYCTWLLLVFNIIIQYMYYIKLCVQNVDVNYLYNHCTYVYSSHFIISFRAIILAPVSPSLFLSVGHFSYQSINQSILNPSRT